MRVVIAPDCFGGTLTAAEAAAAIADGWRRGAPADETVLTPLADGGPGFVEVLHTALGGDLHEQRVTGPLGDPVTARWLAQADTGYVECAQACGLHLVAEPTPATARAATSRGVGELVAAAVAAGMRTVVVGLGGSACTDGGAGLLEVLTAPVGADLVAATDVDSPLLGPDGAAHVFGPQKGADPATVDALERTLAAHADRVETRTGTRVRDLPGAGAAGGIGFALLALGGRRESGAGLVRAAVGLDAALADADVVVTGEGSFDAQSARGKLTGTVAALAAEAGVPCLVLAGQVHDAPPQVRAYAVAEHAGSVAAALADPAGTLTALAATVAADVSPWRGRNAPGAPLHPDGGDRHRKGES